MQEQQPGNEKLPTLEEIGVLAHQLGVTFAVAQNGDWFDLDRFETPRLNGTYRTVQAGIDTAYDDLRRLETTQQAISEVNQHNS